MTLLTITEAARAAGVSRRTIQRSLQSGRLSATTTATGERAIDTTELLRVYGPLRQSPSDTPATLSQPVTTDDAPDTAMLVEILREQLHQAQAEKARLLSLLETEQQARRDLEQKLLPPPPKTAAAGNTRQWILLVLLVIALAVLVVSLIHPELVGRMIGS